MTLYWTSTKASPEIFRTGLTAEISAHLRAAVGVDPAILSAELHISAPHVMAFQRKLGLRKITGDHRK
jgi:hypothetical protein